MPAAGGGTGYGKRAGRGERAGDDREARHAGTDANKVRLNVS
jgi:hypothetical protein